MSNKVTFAKWLIAAHARLDAATCGENYQPQGIEKFLAHAPTDLRVALALIGFLLIDSDVLDSELDPIVESEMKL